MTRFVGRVSLVLGDAQALAFDDGSFDAVTIAFGIRNVPDRARGLAEMARVCRVGGRVAILELGEPQRACWVCHIGMCGASSNAGKTSWVSR